MNKDVIYIEPEDDITDIITKIEKSKEKIIALVPPKKAGVFRSIVNIKLIAKSGAANGKNIVLVTVDPSIVKLAAATKLPVAKSLQSAPVIPDAEPTDEEDSHSITEIADDKESEPDTEPEESSETDTQTDSTNTPTTSDSEKSPAKSIDLDDSDLKDDQNDEEDETESQPKSTKKASRKSAKSSGRNPLAWFKEHKKLTIAGGIIAVALIAFLVWAFGFAPAVDITVAIKTDPKNFSETATFVTDPKEENTKEGKLFLEQKKFENTQEIEFEATGQKNKGEKAIGELTVFVYSRGEDDGGSITVGDVFTYNGLRYVATTGTSLFWNDEVCDKQETKNIARNGCELQGTVKVEAANPGEAYNVAASTTGWSTLANVSGVRADKPITGGTDKTVTVVQQSDFIKAEEQLTTAKESENKQKLYDSIGDDYYIIEVSFEQNTSNAKSSPGVDEEVPDGTKPKLSVTTTATVYVVEKSKVREYIQEKANLEEDQKVYDIKDVYIESLSPSGSGYSGRVKAQYHIGPKITETEVVDKIKGRGLGDAQREIRDLYGVSDVKINTSYPWVMTVPGDTNKVSVKFEIKDQDGNAINDSTKDQGTDEESKSSENSTESTPEQEKDK